PPAQAAAAVKNREFALGRRGESATQGECRMAEIDVLCIGNAIVDIIARCEDDFLVENGIARGAMSLIDRQRAEELYARMGPAVETSGGSAANTAAGIAGLGGSVAFSGKVADDHLGQVFAHDIRAQGVAYEHRPLVN